MADQMRGLFESIDTTGRGFITRDDLVGAIRKFGLDYSDAQTDELARLMDPDESGTIEYDEFAETFTAHMAASCDDDDDVGGDDGDGDDDREAAAARAVEGGGIGGGDAGGGGAKLDAGELDEETAADASAAATLAAFDGDEGDGSSPPFPYSARAAAIRKRDSQQYERGESMSEELAARFAAERREYHARIEELEKEKSILEEEKHAVAEANSAHVTELHQVRREGRKGEGGRGRERKIKTETETQRPKRTR